eukprot:6210535-Pleurochrysis_carterae.AAC.2
MSILTCTLCTDLDDDCYDNECDLQNALKSEAISFCGYSKENRPSFGRFSCQLKNIPVEHTTLTKLSCFACKNVVVALALD